MQTDLTAEQMRNGIEVPESVRDRLRGLRLDHWNEFRNMERCERFYRAAKRNIEADWFRHRASTHMLAVQTLNEFFPIGDYASEDAFNQYAASHAVVA